MKKYTRPERSAEQCVGIATALKESRNAAGEAQKRGKRPTPRQRASAVKFLPRIGTILA
ncbi:MAG: hypothetical protein ABSE67_18295 [Xanthobacteraceae bacterium]|jgi:hypothetical protein